MNFLQKYWFHLAVLIIMIAAVYFRFVNYENRWGLAYDQAHDALVARHAIDTGKLPLLGPFSSAGPFQTGGEWYWIIMLGMVFFPHALLAPWIFMTGLYVVFVFIIIRLSSELVDKKLAIIVGLLAAVSTAQITQGTNLTNQSPQAIISLCAIWCAIRFVRVKKLRYIFLLGLCVGLASSIHLQGAALAVLGATTLLIADSKHIISALKKKKFPDGVMVGKQLLLIILGMIIPWIPVLIVDAQYGFSNMQNMLHYYLIDQHTIPLEALGRRWLTYITEFWPHAWALVVGGSPIIGYVLLLTTGYFLLRKSFSRTLSQEWIVISATLGIIVVMLRYVHTPLFDSYLVSLHPFILLLSGYSLYLLMEKLRVLGSIVIAVIIFITVSNTQAHIVSATNTTAQEVEVWQQRLLTQFPDSRFAVYDKVYKSSGKSLPLSLYLAIDERIDDNGEAIGVRTATSEADITTPIIYGNMSGYHVVDLSEKSAAELQEQQWKLVNPSEIYKTTQDWRSR